MPQPNRYKSLSSPQVSNIFILGIVLLGLVVFLSLGSVFFDRVSMSEMRNAKDLWESRKPESYSYSVHRSCFCAPESIIPYTVRVSSGVITTEIDNSIRNSFDEISIPDDKVLSMDRIFDLVEESLTDADRVDVDYHRTLGYPEVVFIDRRKSTIDDEFWLRVEQFSVNANGAQ